MGQLLTQPPSFQAQLRAAVFSRASHDLKTLMTLPDFHSANVTIEMFVELVQRHWDQQTIERFVEVGSVDNLCALLAAATLQHHVSTPYASLLGKLKALGGSQVFKERRLDAMFPIIVDTDDDDLVALFIQFGCFDPEDTRSLRIAVMNQLRRNDTCSPSILTAILRSHTQQAVVMQELREVVAATGRFEKSKTMLLNILDKFLSPCSDSFLDCEPSVRHRLKLIAHILSAKKDFDEPTIRSVISYLPRVL